MKDIIYTVASNTRLADRTYEMRLCGDTTEMTTPGQFIDIELPELFLRRPLSVCDWDGTELTIIYKAVGAGTELMTRFRAGDRLKALAGLGNGFNTAASGQSPLLIGGGAGCAPLFALAKELKRQGKDPAIIMGFNTAAEIFYSERFEELGLKTVVCTVDGSAGVKGYPTDAFSDDGAMVYCCGPMPLMRAVYRKVSAGQFSLEERMGCGFGACMGCSHRVKGGSGRVCRDGPVFEREELLW